MFPEIETNNTSRFAIFEFIRSVLVAQCVTRNDTEFGSKETMGSLVAAPQVLYISSIDAPN